MGEKDDEKKNKEEASRKKDEKKKKKAEKRLKEEEKEEKAEEKWEKNYKEKTKVFVVVDDCFAPNKSQYLIYKGPNAATIASKLTGSFQPFYRIASAGWGEPDFRWDTSGEPITFFMKWYVERAFSKFSKMVIYITVQGDENSQTKQGKFTLEVSPTIEHTFPQNWLTRGLYWMYDYLFYGNQRQSYIKRCREINSAYMDYLKGEFGLMQSVNREIGMHKM